ncbi:hypothetical protein VNO78_33496 [Psophocarpus tetragonolobus]|uniref:Uncharacterized protein n=1 Tax=Psophocarpus tetragonolobus TaxID=3891 RepID=A0AAN9RLE2_PSOTE
MMRMGADRSVHKQRANHTTTSTLSPLIRHPVRKNQHQQANYTPQCQWHAGKWKHLASISSTSLGMNENLSKQATLPLTIPVTYLSHLQRILPAARWELGFKASHGANPPCEGRQWHVPLGGQGPLLLVGKRTADAHVASSLDSDLEEFSHNPTHDVPPQPNSPPDNVFRPDRPTEAGLGSRKRGSAPLPIHGINYEAFGYLKRVIVTPAVYPRLVEFLHFDIQSTGQKSHCVNIRRDHHNALARSQSVPRPARDDPLSPREQLEQSTDSQRVRGWDPRAQPSEPILFPRLWIHFADFPCLHCSIDQRLFTLETDAVMSTTGQGRHSVLQIFKGRQGRTGHHATCGALPAAGPYLRLSRFQGGQAICTDDRSTRARALGFAATAVPSYLSGPGPCPDGRVSAQLGTVTQLLVHPASPVLLTKNGPLGALDSVARLNRAASDERFARQYRCGPPPEFPLASPRSGIVHHLSGPDRYALTRTLHRRSGSVGGAPTGGSHQSASLRLTGLLTRRRQEHARAEARLKAHAAIHNHHNDVSARISTARAWAIVAIRVGPCPESIGGPALASFSSFPRGTCFLSVSRQYLALVGIYCPIGAAFPNNPTRRQCLVVRQGPGTTGLSPSLAPLSRGLRPSPPLRTLLQTTIRMLEATDSHGGLFPVRSLLLRESLTYTHGSWSPNRQMHARDWSRVVLIHHIITAHTLPRTRFSTNRDTMITGGQHTPSQHNTTIACPQPNGFGHNLRSKTRLFTGFCNSHQVSHFATFFIDARAEISVAESHFASCVVSTPAGHRLWVPENRTLQFQFPWHTKHRGLCFVERQGLGCVEHDQPPPNRRGARRACRPFVGRQIRRSN